MRSAATTSFRASRPPGVADLRPAQASEQSALTRSREGMSQDSASWQSRSPRALNGEVMHRMYRRDTS